MVTNYVCMITFDSTPAVVNKVFLLNLLSDVWEAVHNLSVTVELCPLIDLEVSISVAVLGN